MRRIVPFTCEGELLLGTLDEADGTTGVLIVSGGNEVRHGAHRGMAMLARDLARHNVPVFRFDRRGVGDSGGDNGGWENSAPDIAAAAAAFRAAQPHVRRVIGFGNCDAATSLALFGHHAGIEALILANPWLGDDDALPPPDAIRARYLRQVRDPAVWRRFLRDGIDLAKVIRGLRRASQPAPELPLASRIAAELQGVPLTIVLATGDRTAQTFASCWRGTAFAQIARHATLVEVDTGSHSFVGHGANLVGVILRALEPERTSRGLTP